MVLKAIDVRDKSKCDQMMTEVKTLFSAQSTHHGICPNLVEFYDAFWEDPFMYLAMEYMDCGSLDVPLKRCVLVRACFRACVRALHMKWDYGRLKRACVRCLLP